MMPRLSAFIIPLLTLLLLCSCIDDTRGRKNYGPDGKSLTARGIMVIGSDYLSSSLSIIDRETKSLYREGVIHSGSAAPGLSIALSGDIVFPLTPDAYGHIILIDRYPNSVINFLDAEDFSLEKQLSVATGFSSNPHDYLRLSLDKAYVTRYEKNSTPGTTEFDGGDDILIIDPQSFVITGRVDLDTALDGAESADLHVRPDRMLYAAGLVWVSCDYLNGNFDQAGNGLLLAIDPETDTVERKIEIPEMSNCTGLDYDDTAQSLYVSCTGLFSSGSKLQLERSGLIAIDLSDEGSSYRIISRADDGQKRPYGFETACLEDGRMLIVRFGDITEELNDELVLIDPADGSQIVVHVAATPFGLGGFLFDEEYDTLYVGDADIEKPLVYLYHYEDGEFSLTGSISSHPQSGLPPRHIAFF